MKQLAGELQISRERVKVVCGREGGDGAGEAGRGCRVKDLRCDAQRKWTSPPKA